MAIGYFLRVGDKATCAGQILMGDQALSWYGVAGSGKGCGQVAYYESAAHLFAPP